MCNPALDCRRLGIGRLLLAELIAQCEARGATQMIAVIGDAANAASIRAAPRAGFRACRAVDRRRLEIRALAGRVVDATATGLWRRIAFPYKRMTTIEPTPSADKSKALATWIAIVGGSLGLHRFYLHGFRDLPGWLHPLPTLIGVYGVQRARSLGQDDHLAWVLIPFVGITIAASMLCAIVYGLASDDKWNARFNAGRPASRSGWAAVLGAMTALMVGAGVLMATIAFVAQRYFEYQVETEAAAVSQSAAPLAPPPKASAY